MRTKTDKRQIEYVATGKLTPYARNSRTHSPQQVKQLAASIKEFGFTNPVLIDEANGIIAGHGRVMAAEHLQLTEVPCIRLEYLTETQKRAYVIADNKLAMLSEWDEQLLSLELNELNSNSYNMSLIGFDSAELEKAMNMDMLFEPGSEDDQGKLDQLEPKLVKCPSCLSVFDLRGNEQA